MVWDLGKGGFLGRVQGGAETGQWYKGMTSGLALMGWVSPFSPVEDVVLHSESSSLSESGASHDNGEDSLTQTHHPFMFSSSPSSPASP